MRLLLSCALTAAATLLLASGGGAARNGAESRFEVVMPEPGAAVRFFDRPAGYVIARERRAFFGGPLVLGVVERRGHWAAVTSERLRTGRAAWVDLRSAAVHTVPTPNRVDLSDRRIELYRGGRLLRSYRAGV